MCVCLSVCPSVCLCLSLSLSLCLFRCARLCGCVCPRVLGNTGAASFQPVSAGRAPEREKEDVTSNDNFKILNLRMHQARKRSSFRKLKNTLLRTISTHMTKGLDNVRCCLDEQVVCYQGNRVLSWFHHGLCRPQYFCLQVSIMNKDKR